MAGLDPIGVIPPGALIGPTGGVVDGLRMYDHKLDLYDIDNILVSLSPTEFRVVVPDYAATPGGDFGITLENGSASPITFDIGETGLYDVTDIAIKAPPSYVQSYISAHNTENGNTVVNNGLVEADGADIALAPAPQVLMQAQRTNQLIKSNDIDDVAWTKNELDPTPGQTGFAGFPQSVALVPSTVVAGHYFLQNSNVISGTSYAYMAVVKPNGYTVLQVAESTGFGLGYSNFILTGAGSIGNEGGSSQDASITALPGGEYLITYIADALTTLSGRLLTVVLDSDYSGRLPSYAGDGTSGVLVAHIGMEAGTTSTSPIKTDTAAVTRDIDTLELTDWDSIAPNDEGLIIFATTSPETLSSILDEELITSGTSEYIYRNSNDNGFSSSNGATTTNVNSGGDADVESIVAVIWSVKLDTYCIGYYHSLGTFLWDLSPAQFGGFTPGTALNIIQTIRATRTIRSLLVYEDWPPATGSLADVQTWVTLNAQAEITKHQIQ